MLSPYRVPDLTDAHGMMFFVAALMIGSLRQTIVIWLTAPMIVCGVVLVDEIDRHLDESVWTLAAVPRTSVSWLRPVMLAWGTTIAGMSPLLADVFFAEMAVCIMGGLAFATPLTLVAVPIFYRIALGRRLPIS